MAKKYKCPFCEERHEREKLVDHIEDTHEDLIPENFSARRVVFNSINKKTHGTCVICRRDTDWNEKAGKYDRLCTNPKCKEKMREDFKRNAIAKDGKYNYTADPEFQEKMLKGRKISSTYTFTDGGKVDYVGSYEKKFLEFIDKVMNIDSKDIIAPGPIIEYRFNGNIHYWITDFYYVPANLVLDIKDGGKNPNTRPMEEYRAKQLVKEEAIKNLNKYNYLRLTDNDFSQFIEVLSDLKLMALDLKDKEFINQINESTIEEYVTAIPPLWSINANVMVTNNLLGERKVALSSLDFNDNILIDDELDGIKKISKKEFSENYTIKDQFLYNKNEKYYNLLESVKNNSDDIYRGIYNNLTSFDTILTEDQIYFDIDFKPLINKGISESMIKLSNKVNTINSVFESNINGITVDMPQTVLDPIFEAKYVSKNYGTSSLISSKYGVVAIIDKPVSEFDSNDIKKIEESYNILSGGK